ncbi:methyltransferase [Xanthomonas oryzae]|uniref:major capsid protein n=1 Tax=Xanthomonas oryzae TaxID=347 RepID=UPI000B411702|nr:major capsid protein [Xanthomonas oryzae]OWB30748.1 methyltransferase [Xanthomonas oryzae pv. oryzicola]QBG95947.1 methyltransferase [Xanthomonas oryzae]
MRNLKTLFKNKAAALAAVGSSALVSVPAFAAGGGGVDVSDVVTAIKGAAGPIAAIGGAVLTVLVGIKVYKWVRRAM